ncbi:MAG: hypothetical protein V1773_18325 [bacterium]
MLNNDEFINRFVEEITLRVAVFENGMQNHIRKMDTLLEKYEQQSIKMKIEFEEALEKTASKIIDDFRIVSKADVILAEIKQLNTILLMSKEFMENNIVAQGSLLGEIKTNLQFNISPDVQRIKEQALKKIDELLSKITELKDNHTIAFELQELKEDSLNIMDMSKNNFKEITDKLIVIDGKISVPGSNNFNDASK